MRAVLTTAVLLVLILITALCPAVACVSRAAAHPCCPQRAIPRAAQHCPSTVLEKGKLASPVSAALPVMAAPRFEALQYEPAPGMAVNVADWRDIFPLLRTLRI
jgi:hypothetical protein